jgi:hypothetical protein
LREIIQIRVLNVVVTLIKLYRDLHIRIIFLLQYIPGIPGIIC